MPFTLAHPAAVLPFARRLNQWRALSAAVIGSMAPDFAFILPWDIARIESHSVLGMFTFCLPVGLALYWAFEYLVKPTTREVLPDTAYTRSASHATPDPITSPQQWAVAVIAILFGALTHLVLDGFTHEGARGVRMFPLLDEELDIAGHSLLGFKIAQQAISVVGLAIILYVVWTSMTASKKSEPLAERALGRNARRRWMRGYAFAAIFFGAISYALSILQHPTASMAFSINWAAIGVLRGLIFSLLSVSLLLRARLRAGARRPLA